MNKRTIILDNSNAARIFRLEVELKDNHKRVLFKQNREELDGEWRELLLQRSKLKDQLLDEYRQAIGG